MSTARASDPLDLLTERVKCSRGGPAYLRARGASRRAERGRDLRPPEGASLERLHFLDVSAGSYEAREWIVRPGEWKPGVLAPYAERYRRAYGLAVGVPGRINTPEAAGPHPAVGPGGLHLQGANPPRRSRIPEPPSLPSNPPAVYRVQPVHRRTLIRAGPSVAVSTCEWAGSTPGNRTGADITGRGYWWPAPAPPAWRRIGRWRNAAAAWGCGRQTSGWAVRSGSPRDCDGTPTTAHSSTGWPVKWCATASECALAHRWTRICWRHGTTTRWSWPPVSADASRQTFRRPASAVDMLCPCGTGRAVARKRISV